MTRELDPDEQELAAEDRAKQGYLRLLLRNPDCRDPDHPGCDRCREDDDDPNESEYAHT